MIKEIRLAPPNSLVLITSTFQGEIPASLDGKLVAATSSCIAVGTLSAVDGDTLIILTNEDLSKKCDQNLNLVYNDCLNTPDRQISVFSVLGKALLTMRTKTESSRVQVWTNDKIEPTLLKLIVQPQQSKEGKYEATK